MTTCMMTRSRLLSTLIVLSVFVTANGFSEETVQSGYPVVDTGQSLCYDTHQHITPPGVGDAFFGQDAQYQGHAPQYTDHGDGTITDHVTGLMWQKGFSKVEWKNAASEASQFTTGEYTDWRVPTIKELYSLIMFSGNQGSGEPTSSTPPDDAVPFIDTHYFAFEYPASGRYIDVQYVTSTQYVATTMGGVETFFGVNFADGRIKGYPTQGNLSSSTYYARYVRGNPQYGTNHFVDNGDGTISDVATGLMWSKIDSGSSELANQRSGYTNHDGSFNWEEALRFAETITYAGYSDWRLPNAKELHTIVDYTRAPDVTNSAAINSIFACTPITNEAGQTDFPFYWTSTTFNPGYDAIIIQFGRSLGYMAPPGVTSKQFLDVHGAGGQRTDPKVGELTYGGGPQGDVRRVYNYVRVVREIK
jgi:hypothetical protein